MNRKLIMLMLLLSSTTLPLMAQNIRFITDGIIEFERNINVYAILQKRINKENNGYLTQIVDQMKKSQSQFKLLNSTLYFSKSKTLFKPGEDNSAPIPFFGTSPDLSQINTIYTDLNTQQKVTQKKVFEETFLVKDSTRKINWKITSETRDIAGYSCRRANAIVMDSIYVVAFYTDQIPVSGGPESFSGLPGMILGVALPHDNVTWFAKTVTDKTIENNALAPPAKGKATDSKGLAAILASALKEWGDDAKFYLKNFML